jgi:hypothetical protein
MLLENLGDIMELFANIASALALIVAAGYVSLSVWRMAHKRRGADS